MTYELAKQLKDAGFPQDEGGEDLTCQCGITGCYIHGKDYERVCIPTLSELIEACGDRFHALSHYHEGKYTDGWFASGLLNKMDSFPKVVHSKTPWALRPGFKYSKNIENFETLCKSCHRKQDITEEMIENMRKGWIDRKRRIGLNKIDPKTGRFVKICQPKKRNI